jgi:glycerate kinase
MAAMRVLLAPDKFAGTLSAVEAAAALAAGWSRSAPGDGLDLAPLSDGGPGFVEVLHTALGGRLVPVEVEGPLGAATPAVVLVDGDVAYVEAAQACGLHLVDPGVRDPLGASSRGVGALLAAALETGAARVVVGVGGTASTDGGRGAVEALGAGWPAGVELVVATDVDTPLLGPMGAAAVFGPQKGATPGQVAELEGRLAAWVRFCGADPDQPGAGAGGGLGYGLMALSGRRAPGIDTVLDAIGFDARVRSADLVVTGEGSFDFQSLRGKAPAGVAARSQAAGRPCLVLAGRVEVGRREAAAAGIEAAYAVVDRVGPEAALADPAAGLADLAADVARQWSRG